MEQTTAVSLVVLAVGGIAAAYVIARPTVRRILHGISGGTVTNEPSA
jgi:hypothetical protein